MYPQAIPLFGPFIINSYNGAIMLGIIAFLYAALRNPARKNIISSTDFVSLSAETAIAAIVGARLLHVLSDWHSYHSLLDIVAIWNGGLSVLGGLFGALAYSYYFLRSRGLPLLPVYSLAAIYAPLVHAIARIGCFLIGCCYGAPTNISWAVTYTNPLAHAPLNLSIHPTQLYSSLLYFILFLILRYYIAPHTRLFGTPSSSSQKLGKNNMPFEYDETTLIAGYLMGMSLERFIVDFFRGDRIMNASGALSFLSFHQWAALAIFSSSLLGLIIWKFLSTSSPSYKRL